MIKINASYSTLSSSELLHNLIPQYKVQNPVECDFWARGINDTYKVYTKENKYILRIYRKNWRTLSEIKFEIEALNFINDKGANISYPVMRNDGEYVTSLNTPEGERYAIITTYAEGDHISYDDIQKAYIYGQNVATIHSLSSGFSTEYSRFEIDKTHLLYKPLESMSPFFNHRREDWKFIKAFANELGQIIDDISKNKVDYGFCHGDFHGWNAHISNGNMTFYDFDCCGFGLRAYDIAVFRWGARLRDKESERWDSFLQGYRSKRNIADIDLELTTAFLAIRDIWLMGLHMGNAKDFGRDWIDDSYISSRVDFLKSIKKEHFL